MFSKNLLLTKADCDPVIVYGNDQVTQLTVKQTTLTYQRNRNSSLTSKEQTELTGLDNKITFLTSQLLILTGADKSQATTDLRRATDRRDELRDPNVGTGPLSVLKRELELAYATDQLAKATAFVAEIQAHKDGLAV